MVSKPSPLSGKPQLNRRINASLVFDLLQEEGPLSRPQLAERTGVKLPSISEIVDHLLQQGVVREIGEGKSSGGRRPVLLDVNPSGRLTAGIEVTDSEINGVIVDLAGQTVGSETVSLSSTKLEAVVAQADKLISSLCRKKKISREGLAGIGVAVPGIISKDERRVVLSTDLGWRDVPLQAILETDLGANTHLVNNAMAGALASYFDKPKPRVRSLLYFLVYLTHGRQQQLTSLGCGIVLDGRAYFGEGNLAGEIRADLEHPWAVARRRVRGAPSRIEDFVKGARKSPERYAPVWEAFAAGLGEIISWGVDFLSPGLVIVGSDIAELGSWLEKPIQKAVRKHTVSGLLANHGEAEKNVVPIQFVPIESYTIARGAVVPFLQTFSLAPLLRDSVLS